jgi:ketosteroid isomerase-like protein
METQTSVVDQKGQYRVHVVRWFYKLLGREDIDAWSELWHEDGRIIIPYPRDGFPTVRFQTVVDGLERRG